jgi:hypothetical protein
MRPTPFGLAFAHLARERFAAITDDANRDRFVLQEPVGRLLREIVPEETDADGLEAHVRMLHHAHRHWASGGWVYRVGESVLHRAASGGPIGSHLPHPALYLQLPELQVWGAATAEREGTPEPLDGMFVTEMGEPRGGAIAVLGIFGMREGRPGFSAVSVEGRADVDDPSAGESLIDSTRATRDDGSAPFTPTLTGGTEAGILSVASAGELLLLTCRLLALLPPARNAGYEMRDAEERGVDIT